MTRLGILGSTRGTNMLALIEAIKQHRLNAAISIVISNKPHARILDYAIQHDLPAQYLNPEGLTREAYDKQVSQLLHAHSVDWVVLIGYMRILSAEFVSEWENRVINIHPSLLPAFGGKMDLEVHKAVIAAGVKTTGCTVHFVTAEVDSGPIILQHSCEVQENDTPESLKERVQKLEGQTLVEGLIALTSSSITS